MKNIHERQTREQIKRMAKTIFKGSMLCYFSMPVRAMASCVLVLSLSACVSTLKDPEANVDIQKAVESHVQLGLSYLRDDNRDLARFHLNKALEYDSDSAAALGGMALLYQTEGEPERAEDYFKKAIREDRSFSRTRANYGSFLYVHERYEEAYKQFEVASNDLNYQRRDLALYNLGRTALKLNNVEKAESALIHALTLNEKLTVAMVELAEINLNKENYPAAKKYLDQFLLTSKHTPRTLWLGIRIEKIFGNRDKEASYLLQLKNMYPYSQEYLNYKRSVEKERG